MSETKLDSLLLDYNLARNQRVAKTTYQNAPPGSIDIERHALGNPFCFRSTKIVDQGFILKTIIIADPTLAMFHNVNPSQVAELIKLLLTKNNGAMYLWTGEFIRINTLKDFWSNYQACTSILHNELQIFKEKEQLNQDNIIVLDNTSLQAIAHYILNALSPLTEEESAVTPETIIYPHISGDKESIEPRYFTSDTLMLYDENQQARVLAWHEEHNYPLHLKLNGFAEIKLPEFISYIQQYPQIILYFNELIYSDVEIWLTHLMQLHASQIIGLYQGHQLSPRSINRIFHTINQLPHLDFLSINLPQQYAFNPEQPQLINLTNLDLSKQQQLNYLSIKLFTSRTFSIDYATCLLQGEESSNFLKTLPRSLNYLYLPFTWSYYFPVLNEVLTKHLPCLKELGNTDTNSHSSTIPLASNSIQINGDKLQPILLPQVKIIKQGQLLPIEGIEKDRLYLPFALDIPSNHAIHSRTLDFTIHYEKIREHYNQSKMTMENAINYIDNIINENNLKDLNVLAFLSDELTLNVTLLLLIKTRLPKVNELVLACTDVESDWHEENESMIDPEIKEFLNKNVCEFDTLEFLVGNQVDPYLLDHLFSLIKIKQHARMSTHHENRIEPETAFFLDLKSICLEHIEEAEKFRSSCSDVVISKNYDYTIYQEDLYDLSVDELKEWVLSNEESPDQHQSVDNLINDIDTVENPSKRLSARQLFRTLDGQAVPVHYNRITVRSVHSDDLIENRVTVHPGKVIRYDHVAPVDALVFEATQHYIAKMGSDAYVVPMLHPQDTLYKIWTSHPIELRYDLNRKAYLVQGLTANVPVTIYYQFHSTAYTSNIMGLLKQNPGYINSATGWISESRPYFHLFNHIQFTPEGIDGLHLLSQIPADKLPFVICAYFADFRSGALQLANQYPSAHDIDNAILHQKVGACRHRSNLAFKMLCALVEKGMCAIEANLITSDVHQFLELLIGDEWMTVCLGGFNAQIDLQNNQAPSTEQETLNLAQLEEIDARPLVTLKQHSPKHLYPYEDNIQGWEELYQETEQNVWNSIINGFDPYSDNLMEQSDAFHDDVFFETLEIKQEIITPKEQPPENSFLLTYPKLSFANSEEYRWWLEQQLESNNNAGGNLLLVVDSFDQQIAALQRDTYEHITENKGYFSSISNFQQIKFAELHVDEQGNKDFRANDLGTLLEKGSHGDVLWININQYQAATINPLFDHRKKLRDKQIPHEVLLIAVMEQSQFQEMSDDFTSRFRDIYKLDAHSFQPILAQRTEEESIKCCFVFGEPLLSFEHFSGYYSQDHGQLQWHEGWLTQQIKQGIHHFTLINPPTDLSEFNLLMRSIQQGYYYSNGECIAVPQTISITYKKQPYEYPPCTVVSADQKITIDFVLNKTTLTSLLRGTYELLKDGSMVHHSSLDNINPNGHTVLLSESLSDEEWYSLLCFIRDAGLPIRFALAPGVILPTSMPITYSQEGNFDDAAMITSEYAHLFPLRNSISWIESDALLDLIRNSDTTPDLPPMYLSHDAPISDLLGSIIAQEGKSLTFRETLFNDALRQGKSLMLYGNPNSEVRHLLESLLCTEPYLIINGTKQYITGSLSLYFTPNPHQSLIPVQSMADRDPEPGNKAEPLLIFPHGLENQLYHRVIPRINEQRISIISGLPQSGKSHLLHQLALTGFTIHQGMTHLNSWVTQGGILLIDHCHYATLEEHSLIEQVHHVENKLYLKGQFYPLTPQHKMLLMVPGAKPLNSFFTVNTPSVHCEPFDLEVRLDALIKPLWQRFNTPYSTRSYCWPVIKKMLQQLQGYNGFDGINQLFMALAYINELAQHQSLFISGTNRGSLEYLCNLTLCLLCPAQASKELKKSVHHTALTLLAYLLPEPLDVQVTPMQTRMVCNLMVHLRLLERAQTDPLIARLVTKGIIIEGSPGIGKTYLTQKLVHAMGYQEVTDSTMDVPRGYVLAPTDELRLCKERLILAKDKGYLILFDELNTLAEEQSEYAERSLIAQLIEALEPNHQEQCSTGFCMVASQNTAATFGNRLSLPKELSLRCITLHPGEFRKQDYCHLSAFLNAKEPDVIATEMKNALRQHKQAPKKYKKPTVRSLISFLSPPQVEQSGNKRKRETEEHQPRKTPAKKMKY